MGSSETGGGVVDCSVGSIVWVRRRNGSWWPGKILGPEELTSSLITSPRSGTPVKLLGREDASVDWYNLEKSKRVKSFRCGEFDDCIERAEAAQGMPPKKREKYARREDAIMHAIELERQILEKKYGKMGNSSNGRCRRTSPDAVTSSVYLGNGSGNRNDSRSDHVSQRIGLPIAEKGARNQNPNEERVREGNQLSGDDSASALPRMRGLQDFGLCTVPPAREDLSVVAFRAKRIRNAYLPCDSGDYLIDDQTLSSQLEIPVSKIEESSSYPADMGENHISGSTEDTETDCSETDSLESDSDDEVAALSDGSASIELQPKYPRKIEAHEEHASISSSDDFDELAFPNGLSHPSSSGACKWQLKRGRNIRDLSKMYLNRTDLEVSGEYQNGRSGFELVDKTYRNYMSRYGSDFEGLCLNNQSAMRGYWDDLRGYSMARSHFGGGGGGGGSMLLDVDLKVQANNYRRDVPMISLMSKFNGHAIVGHPIQIEALERGSTEIHVSATGHFTPALRDSPTRLTSVWRTGRRTANSRVPRTFSSSSTPKGSYQKIKALSLIQPERHQSGLRSDGLIKNGNAPTTVACIPVNLVFSRLHEELAARHQ